MEVGDKRIATMDRFGITVQVLSWDGPGADLIHGEAGVIWAKQVNDRLACIVATHPDRYAGLAHLPLNSPEASADELERCIRQLGFKGAMIRGATEGRFLDDPIYEPFLARAEKLEVPLYLHLAFLRRPCETLTSVTCQNPWISFYPSRAGDGTLTPRFTSCAWPFPEPWIAIQSFSL